MLLFQALILLQLLGFVCVPVYIACQVSECSVLIFRPRGSKQSGLNHFVVIVIVVREIPYIPCQVGHIGVEMRFAISFGEHNSSTVVTLVQIRTME